MIIKSILKVKSCDIYVYVYSLKFYNEIFEIDFLNLCNILTSENFKIIIFIGVWN
jgi:hypothetical protein